MSKQRRHALALPAVLLALAAVALVVLAQGANRALVPVIVLGQTPTPTPSPTPTPTPPPGMVEVRGVWVTRFDWTRFNQPADPARIDAIVDNIAAAGFNVVFFQVRGTADAYYASGIEPWAQRVSGGVLGLSLIHI